MKIEIALPVGIGAFGNPPEGVSVKDSGMALMHFQADAFSWTVFVVSWAASVPASLLASWIYDLVKKNAKKAPGAVTIDETRVRFENGQITEYLQKKIKTSKERRARKRPKK